jgi:radical SAM superfamily enzyme YgiQ (UPF0313 family)
LKPKILLVKPYGVADEIIPPISLGLLATQIRDKFDVRILDALKEKMDSAAVTRLAVSHGFNMVGFQTWTKDIHEIKTTCTKLKEVSPEIVTIVGGIHPTMVPERTLVFFGPVLDYAYQGEAEFGLKALMDLYQSGDVSAASLSKIPGLIWREGEIIHLNENCRLADLDSAGFPAWDLMPPSSYPKAPHGAFYRNFPIAPIIITRGCPFSCRYCSAKAASGGKLRSRSLNHVLDELTLLQRDFGVKEFQIEDDNFTLNNRFVEQFCDGLATRGLKFSWTFPNGIRLDTVDRALLKQMKQAGCYALNFGVESGSQRVLDMIKKGLTLEQIKEQITLAHEVGFYIGGFFIVGFPGETREEIEQTIKLSCALPLDRIGVSYFQPFPGTSFFDELVKKGEIPVDWAERHHSSLHNLTYVTETLTAQELQRLRRKMLRSFYFRPQIILNLAKQVNSLDHFYYMAKRSIRWLKA